MVAGTVLSLGSLLQLVPAVLVRDFTNELERHHVRFSHLAGLTIVAAFAVLLAAVLGAAGAVLITRAAQGLGTQLRREVFAHLLTQSVAYHTDRRGGELISRLMNDVGGIAQGLADAVPSLLRGAVTAAAAFAVMVVISWQLALLMLAVLPFIAVGLRLAGRAIYRARGDLQRQMGDVTAFAQEGLGLSSLMLVRSFGRGAMMRDRFARLNNDLFRHEVRVAYTTQRLLVAGQMLLMAGPIVLIAAGGYLIAHHALSVGSFLAFGAVALAGFGPAVHSLSTGVAVIWGSGALWSRVFEILDTPPEIVDRPTAIRLQRIVGTIEVRHASFTYPGQSRRAIDDVSFTVRPGQLVALVGRSGAGKTTVATLIARMIDPQEGSVHLDGHDLRDLTLDSLSDAVGLVFQDAFLLHASIRENLLLGRPQASDAELSAALEAAYLHTVVERLPGGYNAVVGERGHRLSGGERQRMALARAILKDPPILILDEATSHLDTESEQLVQRAFTGLLRHRTCIVIAHRLSTVVAADLILVLDEGRVVERGTHHELVSQSAWYASLYELQLRTPGGAVYDVPSHRSGRRGN
jgi:ATP-binding cassette subfamily B protein